MPQRNRCCPAKKNYLLTVEPLASAVLSFRALTRELCRPILGGAHESHRPDLRVLLRLHHVSVGTLRPAEGARPTSRSEPLAARQEVFCYGSKRRRKRAVPFARCHRPRR